MFLDEVIETGATWKRKVWNWWILKKERKKKERKKKISFNFLKFSVFFQKNLFFKLFRNCWFSSSSWSPFPVVIRSDFIKKCVFKIQKRFYVIKSFKTIFITKNAFFHPKTAFTHLKTPFVISLIHVLNLSSIFPSWSPKCLTKFSVFALTRPPSPKLCKTRCVSCSTWSIELLFLLMSEVKLPSISWTLPGFFRNKSCAERNFSFSRIWCSKFAISCCFSCRVELRIKKGQNKCLKWGFRESFYHFDLFCVFTVIGCLSMANGADPDLWWNFEPSKTFELAKVLELWSIVAENGEKA